MTGSTCDSPAATDGRDGRWPRLRPRVLRGTALLLWSLAVFLAGVGASWWAFDRYVTVAAPDVDLNVVSAVPEVDGAPEGTVRTPNVVGLDADAALEAYAHAGIMPEQVTVDHVPFAIPEDRVVTQSPTAGTADPTEVRIELAQATEVPELVGHDEADALSQLEAWGVRVRTDYRYDPEAEVGTVLEVSPEAGGTLPGEARLTVATDGAAVFLRDLHPLTGRCSASEVVLDGVALDAALTCAADRGRSQLLEYRLDGDVDRFVATVGQDRDGPTDVQMRFEVSDDRTSLAHVELGFGEVEQLTVDTTGVLRLRLEVSVVDEDRAGAGYTGIWGDAHLIGSAEAIDRVSGP